MNTQHTPGPWKVMADPERAALHELHRHRFIVTADTELDDDGCFASGSLICSMRDCEHQAQYARLIALAPDLARFALALAGCVKNAEAEHPDRTEHLPEVLDSWIDQARALRTQLNPPTP